VLSTYTVFSFQTKKNLSCPAGHQLGVVSGSPVLEHAAPGASRAPAWRVTGVTSRRVSGWRSQRAPAAAATAGRQAMGGGRARCERLCEMWARPGADGCTHVDRIHLNYDN
jgi:hypothetical protein